LDDLAGVRDDVVHGAGRRPLAAGVSAATGPDFSLPTGTVTFLLADVAGSAESWEEAPEAMAAAIPRYYGRLDEAIVSHGGVRPVQEGDGDSVVGAFSRASDAIAAALDAQRALNNETPSDETPSDEAWPSGAALRVRMAVHTGEAQLRDGGSYFGDSVMHCARLRGIGHGGQILVSGATAGLVAERLPEGGELIDLGRHRLRDLGRPERVWQLAHPDLAAGFPALRSLDVFQHNLPVQLTPLIGREADVGTVGGLLAEDRLVTLTGSGGVGKTRLALAVAADGVERFGGGVWLVALAGVTDSAEVVAAALAAAGVHQGPGLPSAELLARGLGEEPSLLVLDNCEHLIDGCAQLAAGLLAASPVARILATSREPLGVPGEVSWRVPSLDVPPAESTQAVAALSQYEAVRLFVDRARRARPSFTVSEQNAPAIAQICHRLDGIPLALELAAARCRQLSAERIAQDLDDRFRLLTGGARTVLPRHRTLAASIDWSHDRLDRAESIAFRRLGVFAGHFPPEAAEAVLTAAGHLDAAQIFDLLSQLVDKSLVTVEDGPGGEPRYRLLETLRAYALDRLRTAGEFDRLCDAHARWWLDWLDERQRGLHLDAVVDQVETVHDNLRAALDWSVDQPAVGLRLLGHLARAWQACGRPGDAMTAVDRLLIEDNAQRYEAEWLTAALSVSILVDVARGFSEAVVLLRKIEHLATERGRSYEATVARWLASFDAETSQAACEAAREHGDPYFYAFALIMSIEAQTETDPQAVSRLNGAEVIAVCAGSTLLRGYAVYAAAQAERAPGNLRRCIDLALELTHSRSAETVSGAVSILSGAALLSRDETALEAAVDTAERKLATTSDTWDIAQHRLALLRGEPSRVERHLRDNVDNLLPGGLQLFAREAIDAGDAAVAIAAARTQAGRGPFSAAVLAACEAAATGHQDRWHDALRIAADHGLRLIVADALEGLAAAASGSQSWAEGLRLYGAAQRLRDECEYHWRFGSEQAAISQAVDAARQELDPDEADAAEAEGRGLPWADAVRYAQRARGERKRPRHGWAALTPTEERVVALVAEGLTNPQIATRLLMGRATVKTHLEHIFAKLDVTSRSELASRAARQGRSADPPGPT
jgi:predicted ATPase/class 3 adenylate cyclase/DNA-binding CsgD family transcriptional regulator